MTLDFHIHLRLAGRSFVIHNSPPLFSERHGYRKVRRLFGVAFLVVKRGERGVLAEGKTGVLI